VHGRITPDGELHNYQRSSVWRTKRRTPETESLKLIFQDMNESDLGTLGLLRNNTTSDSPCAVSVTHGCARDGRPRHCHE
jgi:hypothetical protein